MILAYELRFQVSYLMNGAPEILSSQAMPQLFPKNPANKNYDTRLYIISTVSDTLKFLVSIFSGII